jgi:hypothetical protein
MHPLGWAIIAGAVACVAVCNGRWDTACIAVCWFVAECQRIRTW